MKRRVKILLLVALFIFLLGKFVLSPYVVVGTSMMPTLRDMDLCLMRRTWHYRPARGDIVVFRTADAPPLRFVKRVIALPGETISISNGVVVIDGMPLREEYTQRNSEWNLPATAVASNKVYVIGDHRAVSLSETVHGLVATRLVEAQLLAHWRWKR